jgi:hypothetical protein
VSHRRGGWLKLHRALYDHSLWTGQRFSAGQAWVDLLMAAAFEDHEVFGAGPRAPMWVKRGQILTSQVALADRWSWDRKTVAAFLRRLSLHTMVRFEAAKATETGYTLITILNYERFQAGDDDNGETRSPSLSASASPSSSPSAPHRLPTQKKKENIKKGKTDVPSPSAEGLDLLHGPQEETADLFETHFWAVYPKHRHVKKAEAVRRWRQLNPPRELAEMIRAHVVKRATSRDWTTENGRWVPHPTTFLNGRRWEDTGVDETVLPITALGATNGSGGGHTRQGRTDGNAGVVERFTERMRDLR